MCSVSILLYERATLVTNQPLSIRVVQSTAKAFNNIESVSDLVDGEYIFTPVDTSKWQTYRNNDAGFEVKIPSNWFCGNIRLDPTSSKSVVCFDNKDKEEYYAGTLDVDGYVMINFPDLHALVSFSLRNDLVNARNAGSKIYKILIDKRSSVIIVNAERMIDVRDATYSWNIVGSSVVERDVFDGFVETFRFLP